MPVSMKNKKMYLLILGVLALGLVVAAISTDEWMAGSMSPPSTVAGLKVKYNFGLWKGCNYAMLNGKKQKPPAGQSSCGHLPPSGDKKFPKNSLDACRAFAILSAVLIAFGLVALYTGHRYASWLLVGGGVSSLVAMAIWAGELLKINTGQGITYKGSPGYSFYLNLGGGVFALIAGLMFFRKVKMPAVAPLNA
jgi:hypothetical protein